MSQPVMPSLSLEQLIALNDEIAALTRAGVPLDFGLRQLGSEMPGTLGTYARLLGERIAQGEPLDKLLGDPQVNLPRVYQAVVVAGLSAGRLPAVLESLSGTMRRLAELRRTAVVALIYPLILLSVAWLLIALTTSTVVPALYSMSLDYHLSLAAILRPLAFAGTCSQYWGPIGPFAFLAWALIVWNDSSRAKVFGSRPSAWGLNWLPWTRATIEASRAAAVIDIVGLAMENGLPLDRALVLAAEATGDAGYVRDAQALAEAIRRGGQRSAPQIADLGRRNGLPALLTWMLAGSAPAEVLIAALHRGAAEYHRLALHKADVARVMIPMAITFFASGLIVFVYTTSIFFPYSWLLRALAAAKNM